MALSQLAMGLRGRKREGKGGGGGGKEERVRGRLADNFIIFVLEFLKERVEEGNDAH